MADLTDVEILALARAAGVTIPPELVAEVGYRPQWPAGGAGKGGPARPGRN